MPYAKTARPAVIGERPPEPVLTRAPREASRKSLTHWGNW